MQLRFMILLLSAMALKNSFSQAPIAYWPLNNNANDQSGNNNLGIIHGNVQPTADRFGNTCGAFHFDGVSAYIEVPSSASLELPNNQLSITLWYRFDKNKAENWLTVLCKGILNKETPDNPQYRLQVQQNTNATSNSCFPRVFRGSSTISISTDFTKCDTSFTDHLFDEERWAFYAMIYNGKTVSTYLNNNKIFEYAYSGILKKNKLPLFIGMDDPGNREYFEGSLDDLKIYDRAITDNELQNEFNLTPTQKVKEEFDMTSPGNQLFFIAKNNCQVKVNYLLPKVSQSGCGNVNFKQTLGPLPGSNITTGKYLVSFTGISSSGYQQSSSYYLIVKDTIKPVLTMPNDTTIVVKSGASGIDVNYRAVTAYDNCAVKSIIKTVGPASKDFLKIGKYKITYRATDVNGNSSEKSFFVEVKEDTPNKKTNSVPRLPNVDTSHYKNPFTHGDSANNSPHDAPSGRDIAKPTKQDTVKTYLPTDFTTRSKKELDTIYVNNTKLTVRLYDRGTYDGDTVSVFLNKKIILNRLEVNPAGFTFILEIDPTIDNELVFYAENLGSIPPNTAWMVVEDGDLRYEIDVLSDLGANGVIRIKKKKQKQ